jgi:phosphatidylserine/phosphatidylglycerophosphate/cardiolipin synthase-like enzyme
VSVDDRLAAVGGIDLTVERWDTSEHRPDAPLRVTSDGKRYEPIHDIQMLVDGEAAEAVASVMHERWRQATGEDIPLCNDASDPWPAELEPGFVDAPVAVSRTIPASGHDPAVREVRALTEDALQAARQSIYIEAQYLADGWVGDILERSLCQERGPEIVVVTPHTSKGFLEKWTMGNNRDRMIRRLRHADRFGRFRALHPVIAAPNGDCEIFIHSKLMIVDDRLLRIGSANLNRRSTGLDTECDVSIEATDEDTRLAKGIARIRETLLAEHLGVARAAFADAAERDGSLIRAIERLNTNVRCLRPFDHISEKGPMRLMPGTRLLDPRKPLPLLSMLRRE